MTLADLIAKVETFNPSEYTKDDLTQWVSEVDAKATDQVINMAEGNDTTFTPYNYETDAEKTLLIPDQFSDTYVSYLNTKIDYYNKELDRYSLDSAQFEAEWQEYAAWYRRNNMPKVRRRHEISTDKS